MNFQDDLRILSGFVGGLRDPNPADIANVGYGLDEWTQCSTMFNMEPMDKPI